MPKAPQELSERTPECFQEPPKCRPGASDGLQIIELGLILVNYAKILLKSAQIEQIPAESSKILLNVGRSSHKIMNSRGRR